MKLSIVLISILALFLACEKSQSNETEPQKVYRIVYEIMPNEWYQEQAELWKKIIEKEPGNAEAWHNYYNANRYAHFENIDSAEKKKKLTKIIEDMEKAIPNTYQLYLLKYWNTHDIDDLSLIEKAYQLRPDEPETYYPFITHNEIYGNKDKTVEFLKKLYDSQDISPDLLNYNYNVLMSTLPNAILITNGDNDTYPVWILQYVHGIRTDVTVLNISLSPTGNYLEKKLQERNIKIDVDKLKAQAKSDGDFSRKKFIANLRQELHTKYPQIPIYYASTVMPEHLKDIKDNLFIVGLAQRYSTDRIDNLAMVKKYLERDFRLDYLHHEWYRENLIGKNLINRMNLNYMIPMVMLAEHYASSGENERAQEWFNFALTLAEKAGNEEAVKEVKEKMGK